MNLINEPVRHRQFGAGTIIDQSPERVTVEFCKEHGIKKFLYPDAFETFLELNDPLIKQKMHEELQVFHEKEELEQRQRAEEEERRQEEKRRILHEVKHMAARKKSSSKVSKANKQEKGKG